MLNRVRNIGLSWKVQIAPAFLIMVLVGLGAYALQTLRSNQASVDALMAGPVRQSELATDLNTTVWIAHAKLYRLAATAANEKDEKKVQAVAKDAVHGSRQDFGCAAGGREQSGRDQAGSLREAQGGRRGVSEAIEERHRDGRRRCRIGADVHQGRGAEFLRHRKAHRRPDHREQREQGSRDRARRDQARPAADDAHSRFFSGWRLRAPSFPSPSAATFRAR